MLDEFSIALKVSVYSAYNYRIIEIVRALLRSPNPIHKAKAE